MIRYKVVIAVLSLSILFIFGMPVKKGFSITGSDNGPVAAFEDLSLWMSGSGDFDLTEGSMSLSGDTGCACYDNEFDRDTLMEFDAEFKFGDEDDSWVAFKFRAENPDGQVWESGNSYYFLIRKDEIVCGKVNDGRPPTALAVKKNTYMADDRPHTITAGVVNYGDNEIPRLVLKIDDNTVIEYDDHDAGDFLKNHNSVFSVNVFHNAKIDIKTAPDSGHVAFIRIPRPLPVRQYDDMDSYGDKWSISQYAGSGAEQYYNTDLRRGADSLTLAGPGSIVYKDRIGYSVICFDLRIMPIEVEVEVDQTVDDDVLILLNKGIRDSYYGGYGYGLRINRTGRIGLVTVKDDTERFYPGFETGYDFTATQRITAEVYESGGKLTIYIYLNGDATAYRYDIQYDSYPEAGFFGMINRNPYQSVELSGLSFDGHTESYESSDPVKPPYMQDYFAEDGKRFIHWEYRTDQQSCFKVVLEDENGGIVGEVPYPINKFLLPDGVDSGMLYLTALNPDGKRSDKVAVELADIHSVYFADDIQQDRIKIRSSEHGARFYHSESGEEFVINGVNYIRLRFGSHSNFEPANAPFPAEYDPYSAETMFMLLKSDGFNAVRVFITAGGTDHNLGTGGPVGKGLCISPEYMDNVIDFLKRAQRYGIYVLVNFNDNSLPNNAYFKNLSHISNPQDILFTGRGLEAKLQYVRMFMGYIKSYDETLLKTLLAIESQNEFLFYTNHEPFSITQGRYVFYANGKSYDMSDADSRRELANAALKHYYGCLRRAIESVDPDALLAEGTSTLRNIGLSYLTDKGIFPGVNEHVSMTAIEFLSTDIDFLDVHFYQPGSDNQSAKDNILADIGSMLLNTPECMELRQKKPVVMCEYGSFKDKQPSFDEAKGFILEQRDAALTNGLKGIMLWSFDSFSQTELYMAMEDNGAFLMDLGNIDYDLADCSIMDCGGFSFSEIVIIVSVVVFLSVGAFFIVRRYRTVKWQAVGSDAAVGLNETASATVDAVRGEKTGREDQEDTSPELKRMIGDMARYPFICNVFGEFELYYKGDLLRQKVFTSIKARDLLIYLLNRNKGVGREEIIADLWQDKKSVNQDDLFHATLHNLRKSLRSVDTAHNYVVCLNRLYSVEKDVLFNTRVLYGKDLERLLYKKGLSADEAEILERIAGYYNGEYLHSLDYEWAEADREYYYELFEKTVLKVCRHYIDNAEEYRTFGHLHKLLKFNPYYEEIYFMLFEAYSKQKDVVSAKKLYMSYLQMTDELRIKPSERILDVYGKMTI